MILVGPRLRETIPVIRRNRSPEPDQTAQSQGQDRKRQDRKRQDTQREQAATLLSRRRHAGCAMGQVGGHRGLQAEHEPQLYPGPMTTRLQTCLLLCLPLPASCGLALSELDGSPLVQSRSQPSQAQSLTEPSLTEPSFRSAVIRRRHPEVIESSY